MYFGISKIFLVSLIIAVFFILRIIFFADQYAGVEHDSGWYLGVAKNLAKRGIYASYTNTIREEGAGPHPSIHGRFSVQDENGFSYFPAGVSVGPGYILPEALIIKIFGDGFWQYRFWSLMTFTGLLLISFLLIYSLGGFLSLLVFQIWLWLIPQMTTTYAYEAYSEHTATFYLLLSFILLFLSIKKNKFLLIFLAGLFFSFALLTKILFFLTIVSFAPIFIWHLITSREKIRRVFLMWIIFFIGIFLPLTFFEFYRYIDLITKFGVSGWEAINKDIILNFQVSGSGITNINNFHAIDWNLISKKINIWLDVAVKYPLIVWFIYFVSPIVIWRNIKSNHRFFITLFFFASLVSFIWFIFISTSGWARHVWHGLFMGMILISLFLGIAISKLLARGNIFLYGFLLLFLIPLVKDESIWLNPIINQSTLIKWRDNRYVRGLEGFPSPFILPLNDQKTLIDFFVKNINDKDRIYYIGWFLNAEISPLVDKIFFPLDRYLNYDQYKLSGGKSIAIFGPYQQGAASLVSITYVPEKIALLCETVIFSNDSYLLCDLKTNLIYQNNAYN